jgi:hypothetical protein
VEPGQRVQAVQAAGSQAGVPVIKLHEGGRHTGNSLMADAEVSQEVRMRAVGHADKSVNDRYTRVLIETHRPPLSRLQRWSAGPVVRHETHECSPDVLREGPEPMAAERCDTRKPG